MKIEHNVDLSKKTTFHIGGIATNFYIPTNEKELINLIKKIKNEKFYILSGGSNLLINDKKKFKHVIYMGKVNNEILKQEKNIFYIGCSLRIQKVIKTINSYGYGGIEELYSLPAMFGGIIYMNAGIGAKNKSLFTISKFINSVKVYNIEKETIEWIDNQCCNFGHRKSLFQNNKYVILGAKCEFYEQSLEKSQERIKERIKKFYSQHEMGKGTFGSIFSENSSKLLKLYSFIKPNKGSIHFGKKNSNWLVNEGNGKYVDAIYLIDNCKKIHKFFRKNIECEVRIWD